MTSYLVDLPADRWHRCSRCGGKGTYIMPADAHRSAGEVPCTWCFNGTVKEETISQEVYDKRLASQKAKELNLDPIIRQNAEFDALTELTKAWQTLQKIAVVDDDYPEYRHRYEGRIYSFLRACRANGRVV